MTSNTTSFTSELFADIDRKDAKAFASRLSENARVRIGSAEPVLGRAAVVEGLTQFFGMIKSLQHEMVEQWDEDGATIIESQVTYRRLDDQVVTVPAVTIFRRGEGEELIGDYRIFIDLGPVLA